MHDTKHKAFTLVELIVVVTILAILATIGFVSYSSYLTGVRDTNRLAQLVSIHDGLELFRTKKDLPLPDESVDIIIGTETIATQGYAGSNVLETIDFTKGGIDPRDGSYFSYYLTADRKYFQLMAFLEEETNITTQNTNKFNLTNSAQAVDYSIRIPTIYGKKLGILTDNDNTPIQDIPAISSTGSLTLTTGNTVYVAHLTDINTISGGDIVQVETIAKGGGKFPRSCKILLENIPSLQDQDGEYFVNLGENTIEKVYCDMTTDGGGWTFFLHVDGSETSTDFFATPRGTYMSDRSDTGEHYSLSSKIFEHSEMMFTDTAVSPSSAPNLVLFKYDQGNGLFNKGPIPCKGEIDFTWKTQLDGEYLQHGSTSDCAETVWRMRPTPVAYIIYFHSSATYKGNYIGTSTGWGKDGYWYLR